MVIWFIAQFECISIKNMNKLLRYHWGLNTKCQIKSGQHSFHSVLLKNNNTKKTNQWWYHAWHDADPERRKKLLKKEGEKWRQYEKSGQRETIKDLNQGVTVNSAEHGGRHFRGARPGKKELQNLGTPPDTPSMRFHQAVTLAPG